MPTVESLKKDLEAFGTTGKSYIRFAQNLGMELQ